MADFLVSLGRITQPALANEQLRQLKSLSREAAPGTLDRLHIAHQYAYVLNFYERRADAIDVLQAALDEFQAANQGILPVAANDALDSFVGFLRDAGHFARGEKVLLAQLEHPANAGQRRFLIERMDELYRRAIEDGGEVSLGKGQDLYQALNAKIQRDLAEPDQNHRYLLLRLLDRVYRTAHDKKLTGVTADVKTFAFDVLPSILKEQTNDHESVVAIIALLVHDLVGPRDGIVFLLDEIDREPRWLRYNNQDCWTRQGFSLTQWRLEAKDLGDVEERLLKRVLIELRRDLETQVHRSISMYWQRVNGFDYYWKAKEADFAKTAEDVLAQRKQSGTAVVYIADYLFSGIDHRARAIEVLFGAHNQKLLDEAGEVKLVDYLQEENRHADAITVLRPLVERFPENLDYRVKLMHAYSRTNRPAELLALLAQTDAFYHQKNRWNENVLARLAHSTLKNKLHDQSVAYFKELIPLYERTHPGRGIGDGTLAGHYIGLAEAYAGLGKTREAVDAAGAAIVAWGPQSKDRTQALETLKQVLLRSPDLEAFVADWNKQTQDSAIVRKALGQAYRDKRDYKKAIRQFELAALLQPSDAETYPLLIEAYDKIGDKEGAIRQLLSAVGHLRRDLTLFEQLGDRYTAIAQPAEAERAYTSIVESQPMESESHALLAEVREKQSRWSEAIALWQQVATLRALEPTGLLKLAAAQIHEKQWDQARASLRKLEARTWPARFGDVGQQTRAMESRIGR
jgi:tetratricopeptide (TPR) repeat protein